MTRAGELVEAVERGPHGNFGPELQPTACFLCLSISLFNLQYFIYFNKSIPSLKHIPSSFSFCLFLKDFSDPSRLYKRPVHGVRLLEVM